MDGPRLPREARGAVPSGSDVSGRRELSVRVAVNPEMNDAGRFSAWIVVPNSLLSKVWIGSLAAGGWII
jgi:hypothetical protein